MLQLRDEVEQEASHSLVVRDGRGTVRALAAEVTVSGDTADIEPTYLLILTQNRRQEPIRRACLPTVLEGEEAAEDRLRHRSAQAVDRSDLRARAVKRAPSGA